MMLGNFDKKTCASFFLVVIPFWRNVGRFFVEQFFSPKRNFRVYQNPSPVSIGEQCSKLQNLVTFTYTGWLIGIPDPYNGIS